VVEVGRRDPFVTKHGERLVEEEGRWTLPRPGGLCVCLERSGDRYTCTAYVDRPRSCRDFERGSDNCLVARRRVHLTP
jgi:hypothetical protein